MFSGASFKLMPGARSPERNGAAGSHQLDFHDWWIRFGKETSPCHKWQVVCLTRFLISVIG